MTLKEYYTDPFGFFDRLDLTWKGNQFNIFRKHVRLRKTAFVLALLSLGSWIIFGFDSTPLQFIHVLYEGLPNFWLGHASLTDLAMIYHSYYGREMHYSAFVIYGLMYWALSRHFDKKWGITGSKNITYAASITLLSIAVFEYYWIYSFSFFQRQTWVSTWRWPQLRILMQNLVFLVVGVMGVLYLWLDSYNEKTSKRHYKFNWNATTLLLICLAVGSAIAWWFYPFPVEQFNVTLETGQVWTNNRMFPQTLYTVDLNPTDNVNAGVWYWKENNLVHAWNTLVKVFFTLAFFNVARIREVE